MTNEPDFTPIVVPSLEDAATDIQTRAKRLMNRENTDFLGRMSEAMMEAEVAIDENDIEEYRELMLELAALAMAQAAISSVPGMTLQR